MIPDSSSASTSVKTLLKSIKRFPEFSTAMALIALATVGKVSIKVKIASGLSTDVTVPEIFSETVTL